MKLTFKNVFLSVGVFVFALVLVGTLSTNKAEAANTCTAAGSGGWNTPATWTNGGADCDGTTTVPGATDTVIIPTAVNVL